jgi:hypothetical protein
MATKSKTVAKKTESKTSTSAKSAKSETAKTETKSETAKTETKSSDAAATGSESSSDSGSESSGESSNDSSGESSSESSSDSSSSGGGKSSTSDRPISYFSSVSTDDYRSGWDGVFGKGPAKAQGKPAKKAAKPASQLPMTITLEAEDLDAELRVQLEAIFRKQAKKKRLNYDKLSGNGQVSLQVSCRISNA